MYDTFVSTASDAYFYLRPPPPLIFPPIFQNKALQSNGHNCGVWVLCTMAAVMRGYTTTSLSEADMGRARQVLTGHILTLPLT
ncbi:hypothetical protein C8R45DRAFT_815395 [Mycena sanguinolenta]|nr:hypothetical protein C8R45DRAFT_815395 [Mycena sanguinolenta]